MTDRVKVAIIGSGNIGTDLMIKVKRLSKTLGVAAMCGIDPESDGLARARRMGVATTSDGIDGLMAMPEFADVAVVFDATSAGAHLKNDAALQLSGVRVVDLTPAAIGPFVVPAVNLPDLTGERNVNMVTCGGQATIPMVAAIARVSPVRYAEIVASIASRSAGPGTRANIDEFTATTSRAIELVGGAARGKAVIILNPVEPPMIMRDTVFCAIPADADRDAIAESVARMVAAVQEYVPGYALRADPQFDEPRDDWSGNARVAVFLEVRGNGDYLPEYAGNLDIMTAAAARVGEQLAQGKLVPA
jgi:acetaldehyde dehydrogenase